MANLKVMSTMALAAAAIVEMMNKEVHVEETTEEVVKLHLVELDNRLVGVENYVSDQGDELEVISRKVQIIQAQLNAAVTMIGKEEEFRQVALAEEARLDEEAQASALEAKLEETRLAEEAEAETERVKAAKDAEEKAAEEAERQQVAAQAEYEEAIFNRLKTVYDPTAPRTKITPAQAKHAADLISQSTIEVQAKGEIQIFHLEGNGINRDIELNIVATGGIPDLIIIDIFNNLRKDVKNKHSYEEKTKELNAAFGKLAGIFKLFPVNEDFIAPENLVKNIPVGIKYSVTKKEQ